MVAFLWSLFVLINNTAKEYALRPNDWDFWAKLVLAAIGCTGGAIFMYIQCKTYYHLCLRWKQHNRIIVIQPITEEMLKKSHKPAKAPSSLSKKSQESSPEINVNSSIVTATPNVVASDVTATNVNASILTSNFIYPITNQPSMHLNAAATNLETIQSQQNAPASIKTPAVSN